MKYTALADQPVATHEPTGFISKYIWSQDHKVIAIQYALTAVFVGLVALTLSALMRLQLGFPDTFDFINPNSYLQFVTMHGMIMVIYLLTAILLGGFGNYLIPLMIGARDMVFPYLNMLSYWTYLLAVIVLMASFFVPEGPTGAGWTLYPPQTILKGTPGYEWGIICMLASLAIFIVAFTMGGLNYVTTILQARAAGMTLMRMPLTLWGIFIATIMGLLAFPALLVSAIMMLLDKTVGTSFFMPALVSLGESLDYSDGSPLLFQHLFWFFGHPEVYIVALPAFGIVSDILATHARKNIFGYRMMVWAIVIIGLLSFVVWAHHMYVSGMNPTFGFFFATTTLIIAVPTAIKVYNWVLTLWRGNIHLTVPMLFAIGFIFTFTHGGLSGLFLGNVVVDLPLSDTYFVVAHFHMGFPHHGSVRRHLSLVPPDHRAHSASGAGQTALLGNLSRYLRHLSSHALPGLSRRAPPLLRHGGDRFRAGLRPDPQRGHYRFRTDRRSGPAYLHHQPVLEPETGLTVRAQSLARHHTGVADPRYATPAW